MYNKYINSIIREYGGAAEDVQETFESKNMEQYLVCHQTLSFFSVNIPGPAPGYRSMGMDDRSVIEGK